MPEVLVLMGSANDWKHLEGAVGLLKKLGIDAEVHVSSAHRTPHRTVELVEKAEAGGCLAFICAAGMAAHLGGVVAAHTTRPVLGVPLPGGVLDGVDALLSTVQMPSGIPVATFAVGPAGAKNAAVFAAQIVGSVRPEVRAAVSELREAGRDNVMAGDRDLTDRLAAENE